LCEWKEQKSHKIFVRNPKEKIQLERARYRWEANIKINSTELVCERIDGIRLAQNNDR